jgi:hypothetical protein
MRDEILIHLSGEPYEPIRKAEGGGREGHRRRIEQYQAIYKKADDEDRDPSEDERLEIESHLKGIETLKKERPRPRPTSSR